MTTNGLSAQSYSSQGYRTLLVLGALLGVSVTLGACQETTREIVMANNPDDYRFRHPIAIEEANKSVVIFVGHARGGLTAPQQSDVIGLAQIWQREATGAIVADDVLEGSDVILPPPDMSLEEAKAEFSGEGLIPR